MTEIAQLIETTGTHYCLDCGVCTSSCPVARVFPDFSPRRIIERALYGLASPDDETIWDCLTCSQCSVRCPANIDFPDFIRKMRGEACARGNEGVPTHNSVFQTIAAIQTGGARQNRTYWAPEGSYAAEGEVFYFVGCRPFFEVVFEDIGAGSLDNARNILKILNTCGITPAISNDERCCGHDALWNGDETTFKRLAELNLEAIARSGASKVVVSCPEGYNTLRDIYPRYFGELPFQVVHILDFIADQVEAGELAFQPVDKTVTYHDPCRLGRQSGIYYAPRRLLEAIPELTVKEMPRNRENGVCCGTTGWKNCSSTSATIRRDRLAEALATGAEALVTACPKCQIHFRCTNNAFGQEMEILDLYDLAAENLVADK
jgi:heterodisulfide reductase subunit D